MGFQLALTVMIMAAAPEAAASVIQVPTVLIKVVDQAAVPAREAGVLTEVRVRPGDEVREGDLLAKIDDLQAQSLMARAGFESEIAATNAENNVDIRSAEKTLKVAEAELRRAKEAVERFNKSVSQTELERLQLAVEQAMLAIEKATQEQTVRKKSQQLKGSEFRMAELSVQRRQITAPLSGVVVEVDVHRGEWVEPGVRVVRIVRIDRLLAEGFVPASRVHAELKGRSVTIAVEGSAGNISHFSGKVVFVSPEIDPVDHRVRIHAELDNTNRRLSPGQRATMIINAK